MYKVNVWLQNKQTYFLLQKTTQLLAHKNTELFFVLVLFLLTLLFMEIFSLFIIQQSLDVNQSIQLPSCDRAYTEVSINYHFQRRCLQNLFSFDCKSFSTASSIECRFSSYTLYQSIDCKPIPFLCRRFHKFFQCKYLQFFIKWVATKQTDVLFIV